MRSRFIGRVGAWVLGSWLGLSGQVFAQSGSLEAGAARAGQIRVDGDLGEWRGLRARALGDDDARSVDLKLAFDANGLFVGAACHDDALVSGQDALIVDIALHDGTRLRVNEVKLYAGDMGRTRARMSRGGADLGTPASIVEGPLDDGYVVEAFVPWAQLEGGANFRFARARVRMLDVDKPGGAGAVIETSRERDAERWPWLWLEGGPIAQAAGFMRDKNLASAPPKLDRLVDVRGDARVERVMVVGSYVVVSDPDGAFAYVDLPVTLAADVRTASLQPRAADGKLELRLGLRRSDDAGTRDVAHVVDITGPTPVVTVVPEPPPPEPAEPAKKPIAARAAPSVSETVIHLEPPGTDALVAAYKEARGLAPEVRPRFAQHCNLAEDKRIESILLFGPELLIVGDGFAGGAGYFFFGLPVRDGADVLRVFTGDVTGDGRREIFVRVRQIISDVQREILLAYTYSNGSLSQLLQVEVRRARGAQSVGNVVSLVKSGKHYALQVDPGFAQGWSAADYPYVRDSGDGIGPLLLPWSDTQTRYVFDGRALAATPSPR